MNFAIVGSGFSGSVLAHELSSKGHHIDVYESRDHIGGNCFTERDKETNIMLHKYGPHIFHTDDKNIWNFINKFSEFVPYINRVKVTYQNNVFSLPINLHTINQFFKKSFNPAQAKEFLNSISKKIDKPASFEEQALKFIGKDLYEAFFKGYTIKQWGIHPSELPASILKRLPVRFNYDDNYFNHKYQGIPKNGYTPIFESLLSNQNIQLYLNTVFNRNYSKNYDHIFYTGPLDGWFNYCEGRLGYRTLDFKMKQVKGDFQGCAVMNYSDQKIKHTRITEHKHFTPWEKNEKSIIFKEFSRKCNKNDIPYYPIRLLNEKALLLNYISMAKKEKNVSFLGRLGTYRYIDMDATISEALQASIITLEKINKNETIPTFFIKSIT